MSIGAALKAAYGTDAEHRIQSQRLFDQADDKIENLLQVVDKIAPRPVAAPAKSVDEALRLIVGG